MAPSTTATAQGMPGTNSRATTATASTVTPTATRARLLTGSQLARKSRGDESNAASVSVGATNSARQRSGSSTGAVPAGTRARRRPGHRQQGRIGRADPLRHDRQHGPGEQQHQHELEQFHPKLRPAAGPTSRHQRTLENLVGANISFTMVLTIAPSFSVSVRLAIHSGSDWNAPHFCSRSARLSHASM